MLGQLRGMPIRIPSLVDAGKGWLLLQAVEVVETGGASRRDAALTDLARLHDAFVDEPVLGDPRLRGVTGRELAQLRKRSATLAGELGLPEPLRALAADAEPLLAELRSSTTLIHGDA